MTDDDIVKKSYWEWASADGSQQMCNKQAFTDRGIWDGATGKVWPLPGPTLTDHAAATVAALQRIIGKLNAGTSPEDLGRDVELLGRIMARRT